jgi:glutathione synthase/RimK-type ligase-like ATP-grasp enzyme
MATLGIAPHNLTKEGSDLLKAGRYRFDSVVVINPHRTWAALEYDKNGYLSPKIYHDGEDISNLDMLVVRGSREYGAAISVMSRVLALCGCYVVDPPTRYSVGYSSKITTSIRRYEQGVGSETYYAFYREGAHDMVTHLRKSKRLPIIIKPVDGKRSRGRKVMKTAKKTRPEIEAFFDNRKGEDMPFYVQPFEEIAHEYRVLMVNGRAIAVAEKIKKNRMARGSRLVVPEVDKNVVVATAACETSCSDEGIVGVDVAVHKNGCVVIIEENRAPMWRRLNRITDFDVASRILDCCLSELELKHS